LKRETILILALLCLAFGLRVWGLAEHNIWWDEGLSVWAARLPVSDILHWTAHDVHPPLHFLLLRGWWLLVGPGEFVLRFPSVLAGALGVCFVYKLGKALGGSRAGLLAALFLALSRFAIAWSQEMRMYIEAATLAIIALWAAVRAWQGGGGRFWIAYVAAVTGGLWTLYLSVSVPIIANLALVLVWLRRGRPRRLLIRWAMAQLAVALLFAPWLLYALPRMPTWSTAEPFSPAFFAHLYATMLAVGLPLNLEAYTPLTLAALGTLAAGLVALWRSRRTSSQMGGLAMLIMGLALPALVVYIVSLPIHFYYAPRLAPRYLLPLSCCFYTLLGWGLAVLARKKWRAAALGAAVVITVALSGLASFYPGRARRDDYVSLAATLRAHRHPGDGMVLHTDKDWPIFAAHYAENYLGVPNGASIDAATAERILAPLWERKNGLWLALTPDALRNDPHGNVMAWLEDRAVDFEHWRFGENDLYFYARTPERAATLHDLTPDFEIRGVQSTNLLGAEVPLPRYRASDTVHLFLYWDSPPEQVVDVWLRDAAGNVRAKIEDTAAPPAASNGPTRQQVDLPLTADLASGAYRIMIQAADGPEIEMGDFALVQRGPATSVQSEDIAHPLDLQLGEHIRLLGYDLQPMVLEPGGTVKLTLYWQTSEPVAARYKVFTHLLGATYNADTGNFLWGQQDSEPNGGQSPTSMWVPGELVADHHSIPVAADAPPGQYHVEVGLYGLVDGARLPLLVDGEAVDDRVILRKVEVRDE